MKSLLSRYSDRIGSNVGDMCRHRLIGIGLNIPPGCPYQIHPLTKIGKHIAGNLRIPAKLTGHSAGT